MPDKKSGSGSDRRGGETDYTLRQQEEQQHQIEDLQHQVRILTLSMGSISGYEGIVNLIDNGLSNIAAQLEPLADLRPVRTGEELDDRVVEALGSLQAALRSPKWSGSGTLGIEEKNVLYIGEVPPAEPELEQRPIVFVEMETD